MNRTVHSEVVIIFRVHAPFASSRERVWLLGSLPELGEWNAARAIETGQVEGEWKVWQARVRMPMNSSFQWAWCTLLADGRVKQWECSMRRQRQIFYFSGVLHTCWGDPTLEIFKQNMGSALLLTDRRTKRGDVVAAVGSSPTMGSWDPAKAAIANEYPPRSGHWSVTVYYDSAAMLEWNWVIISKETKEVKLTEKRNTRFLYESHGWIKLHAPWNKDAQAVDWTPKEHSGGGDFQLGTVELLNITRDRKHEIRRWEERAEACRLTGNLRGIMKGVTATLQLDSPRRISSPPSPRLVESPSFPAEWAESHKPDEDGGKSTIKPKPLLPAIRDDFVPVLKIKPYKEESSQSEQAAAPVSRQEAMMTYSPFFQGPSSGGAKPGASAPTAAAPVSAAAAKSADGKPGSMAKPAVPPFPQKSPTAASPKAAAPASPPPPILSRQVPPSLTQKTPTQKPVALVSSPQQPQLPQAQAAPKSTPEAQKPAASPQQAQATATKQEKAPAAPSTQPASGKTSPAAKSEGDKTAGPVAAMSRRSSSSSQTRGSLVSRGEQGKRLSGEQEAVSRQVSQVPVDITKAGYTLAPCPSTSKGQNRDLVSDPGRPGFAEGLAAVHVSMMNQLREDQDLGPQTTQSLDKLPLTPFSTPFTSPPVRRIKDEGLETSTSSRRSVAEAQLGTRGGSSTSLASSVGILGAACDKPQPALEDLRSLSELREQARQSDRLRGVMDREERNRLRFEQSKQLEAAQMAQPALRIRRSTAPKKDQGTET